MGSSWGMGMSMGMSEEIQMRGVCGNNAKAACSSHLNLNAFILRLKKKSKNDCTGSPPTTRHVITRFRSNTILNKPRILQHGLKINCNPSFCTGSGSHTTRFYTSIVLEEDYLYYFSFVSRY
ncbi:hypothetical protein M0802_013566 [Mischocyttarus mexicanus]|nr:hypothetical protein M0802_013566 [Mischocyttarus mexicanus]